MLLKVTQMQLKVVIIEQKAKKCNKSFASTLTTVSEKCYNNLRLRNSCKGGGALLDKKEKLLTKLFSNGIPRNFTVRELETLMGKCNCKIFSGGRGSSIGFFHEPTGRTLQFDSPHPEKNLYPYQIKKVKKFLKDVCENDDFE